MSGSPDSINKRYAQENWFGNPLGIPAYDNMVNEYDAYWNLANTCYYLGEPDPPINANLVARLEMTYDANRNMLTMKRVK